MELLIAMTLLSLLTGGLFMTLRIGLNAMERSSDRFSQSRRVIGVERVMREQMAGVIPALAACRHGGQRRVVFQGEPQALRLVTSYSLMEASRGYPRLVEYLVAPSEKGGVRLLMNEYPYAGPDMAARLCVGETPAGLQFRPVAPGPASFVLADNLASARFVFLRDEPAQRKREWIPVWQPAPGFGLGLPSAIRIEMAPLRPDPARLQVASLTLPIYANRNPHLPYEDYEQLVQQQ
jgi:general secretion pathway protein J